MHNSTMPPFSLAFPSLTAKVDSYHIIRQHLMPYSKGGAEGAETLHNDENSGRVQDLKGSDGAHDNYCYSCRVVE